MLRVIGVSMILTYLIISCSPGPDALIDTSLVTEVDCWNLASVSEPGVLSLRSSVVEYEYPDLGDCCSWDGLWVAQLTQDRDHIYLAPVEVDVEPWGAMLVGRFDDVDGVDYPPRIIHCDLTLWRTD